MSNGRSRSRDETQKVAEEIANEIKKLDSLFRLEADTLVEYGERMGDFLANRVRLKTTQIRKFLDAVNNISAESVGKTDFPFRERTILLKPKLAYAAGRQDEVKPLMTVLDPCMDRVKSKPDFDKFARFVESIVAYHKYHGGRD